MKIYVVTAGAYSDYGIQKVFTTKKKAEMYCALKNTNAESYDLSHIEEYDSFDNEIDTAMVYKCIDFACHKKCSDISYTIELSTKPFEKYIGEPNTYVPWLNLAICSMYFGRIPITNELSKEQVEKIVRDEMAKFLAEKEGL